MASIFMVNGANVVEIKDPSCSGMGGGLLWLLLGIGFRLVVVVFLY